MKKSAYITRARLSDKRRGNGVNFYFNKRSSLFMSNEPGSGFEFNAT
jgi:hypothetical protein